jgi:hypothetical protein
MRPVLLLGLLCVACTRDNPAFDGRPLADGGTGDQGDGDGDSSGDGDGDGTGDGDGDGDGDPDTGTSDLPPDPPICEFQPADGLSLRVDGPDNYGAMCAAGVNTDMKILSVNDSELVVESCTPECVQCFDLMLTISTYPLTLEGHIPMEPGKCLSMETQGTLAIEPHACSFGALTIYEPNPITPYVVATSHSWEPTPMGAMMLAGSVPAPIKAGNCSCEDVGQGNDCCYMAEGPPEFWSYPLEGENVLPGGFAPLNVPNQLGLMHAFKLFQAQVLRSCENQELQLSWAVVAEL